MCPTAFTLVSLSHDVLFTFIPINLTPRGTFVALWLQRQAIHVFALWGCRGWSKITIDSGCFYNLSRSLLLMASCLQRIQNEAPAIHAPSLSLTGRCANGPNYEHISPAKLGSSSCRHWICVGVQKSLLDILNDQGLSETHLMAETWTQLEGALPHAFYNMFSHVRCPMFVPPGSIWCSVFKASLPPVREYILPRAQQHAHLDQMCFEGIFLQIHHTLVQEVFV